MFKYMNSIYMSKRTKSKKKKLNIKYCLKFGKEVTMNNL